MNDDVDCPCLTDGASNITGYRLDRGSQDHQLGALGEKRPPTPGLRMKPAEPFFLPWLHTDDLPSPARQAWRAD